MNISQKQLLALANMHEPKASASLPGYRFATCVKCGRKLFFGMWHIWLRDGLFKKEIHLCKRCGKGYE